MMKSQFRLPARTALAVALVIIACAAVGVKMRGAHPFTAHAQVAVVPPSGSPLDDFNNDGVLDIAYINADDGDGRGSVTVEFGLGDGSFLGRVNYKIGLSPGQLVVADFNRDGKPDLAVHHLNKFGSQAANTLTVLLGQGDGTFGARRDYRIDDYFSIAPLILGDFDRDGKLDLLFISLNKFYLLAGDGEGGFVQRPSSTFRDRQEPVGVTGDFNLDGKLDVALANVGFGVSVLLGKGDGTFAARNADTSGKPLNLPTGAGWPEAINKGDFNGNGKLDLLITDHSKLAVLLGKGDGTFEAKLAFPEVSVVRGRRSSATLMPTASLMWRRRARPTCSLCCRETATERSGRTTLPRPA